MPLLFATAPYHAVHLFPEDTPDYIQTTYQNLRYHSITTVYSALCRSRPSACAADRICRRYGAMAGVSGRTRFADKRSRRRH